MEDFIRIEQVTKRFGSFHAVDHADFAIRRGEFFSLLGPSGCGKTTLLRMIAGFEFPTEGRILIDSADVSVIPANRRPTNMVFQSYAIFPHLSVFDNIAYGLRRERLSRKDLDTRVNDALAMIKLDGLGTRQPNQLSGGQRQRVALARALVKRPKVLLLDEPLSALDKKLREEMQIELRQIQKKVGITFVFVTHDQEEALSLSDRVAVMFRGKVMQIAKPGELYENPSTVEVADFIGNMNFFPGTVKGISGGSAQIETQGLGLMEVPVPAGSSFVAPAAQVTAAIRPEKFDICTDNPRYPIQLKATVMASAYLGDRSHYLVSLPGLDKPISIAYPNTDRDPSDDYAHGTTVTISWLPQSIVLLPPTGA